MSATLRRVTPDRYSVVKDGEVIGHVTRLELGRRQRGRSQSGFLWEATNASGDRQGVFPTRRGAVDDLTEAAR